MSYAECTCYRVWQSITPPPPCPMHEVRLPVWTAPSVQFTWSTTWPCSGRHCATCAPEADLG